MQILLVEDEEGMVTLLTHYLEGFASYIDTADTLQEGLRKAEEHPFNVVILDLRLKDSEVDQTISAISRFKKRGVAVAVVSGAPDPTVRERSLAAGADAFVAKDGEFNELAVQLTLCIAALKVPETSPRSATYQNHVDLLRKVCNV